MEWLNCDILSLDMVDLGENSCTVRMGWLGLSLE